MKTNLNPTANSSSTLALPKKIELLSPAKNLECGIAAIQHGADAVYIGASQFGARAAAGNSIDDIATLVKFAHQYRCKVLVAVNTVLTDAQLADAEKLIWDIYKVGADAIIIQDMGILQLNLPPIAIHASTQTDNRTAEKVHFLQQVGFSRVVLARELNLEQIAEISAKTEIELEAFVHGALCVSYSGQCYMSQANCGRSANRGQCAQYCRLPYQLLDADGNILLKNKHLLSLKDLDLSDSLEEMMEAGITSFKIEGRLKDVNYVKNVTAFYRQKLDAIFDKNPGYVRASAGKTTFFFQPNPEKSFRRSATDYFLHGRHAGIVQPETPKSLGEPMGKVTYIGRNFFEMQRGTELNNGDGLCFINRQGDLTGFRVNRVEGKKLFPADMPRMDVGVFLYRNQDQEFEKILQRKTADRRVGVSITFNEIATGFALIIKSEDGIEVIFEAICEKQLAQKTESVIENIKNQLSKLGTTIYEVVDININIQSPWFLPASQLSEWRRMAIEKLQLAREESYVCEPKREAIQANYPTSNVTYLANITNTNAEKFYRQHGVNELAEGFEIKAQDGVPLMYCKHCIKHSQGWCPKEGYKATFNEPLFLKNNDQIYQLTFDCKRCEMHISKAEK